MKYWYNQLHAIPSDKDSTAYRRLERIWADRTRYHGASDSPKRYHELYNTKHETNLTVTLWENFILFEPDAWLKGLFQMAGLDLPAGKIKQCNWSYEWEKRLEKGIKLCDIVLKFVDEEDQEHLLVIESKNLHKAISDKDTQPEYYLDIEDFERFGNRRYLIYCIDEAVKTQVEGQILASKYKHGIITWQDLASLQFKLVKALDIPEGLKQFTCGTILSQFNDKLIQPSSFPFEYLAEELSQEALHANTNQVQTTADRTRKYWDE